MQSKNILPINCTFVTCSLFLSLYLLQALFSSEKIVTDDIVVHRELQSIERTNRRKPDRPSRQYSYGSQLGPEPFDRKATNENESKDGSRMITSHQFVITGDKSAEDLTLCCLNDMRNAVEDTVEDILEIFQNENRKLHSYNKNSQSRTLFYDTSIQYLLFTSLIRKLSSCLKKSNIYSFSKPYLFLIKTLRRLHFEINNLECPGSYSSVAVKFVTELTLSESNTGMSSQKLNQKINESIHNGDMKLSMYRYGFPSSDILSLQAMLCPGETLKPSAMPSVVPTVRQPTVNAVSLLFQVSLAGGKNSVELSECCREQVLNGAKKSLSAVLDGLSGRRHLDTKKRRYLEKENEIMALEVDNFWDNPGTNRFLYMKDRPNLQILFIV